MSSSNGWVAKIRQIHNKYFTYPWGHHLDWLNTDLCLAGKARLVTNAPGLPPVWINGNIEALEPHRWVLVISLNPGLGRTIEDAPPIVSEQHSTPEERSERARKASVWRQLLFPVSDNYFSLSTTTTSLAKWHSSPTLVLTGAEDKALQGCNLSADSGARPGLGRA